MTEQKNYKKAGILIGILVVPALVVVVLKFFSVHEAKELPFFAPKATECQVDTTKAYYIPAHQAVDHTGKSFSNEQLAGKVSIVNFIIGTDTYEQLHYSMARVQERFKGLDEVQFLSYTTEPETDSVSLLNSLANKYDALPNKWLYLNESSGTALATCGYGTELVEHENKMKPYQFVLVDKEQRIRGYYNGMERKEVDKLMTEVAVLLLQYEKQ